MKTPDQLYRFHVQNFRAIDQAFSIHARLLRAAIARDDRASAKALLKTQTLLLGVWAETRLSKVLYEDGGFSSVERDRVRAQQTLLEKWATAVEVGFRKHFGVPHAALEPPNISFTGKSMLNEIQGLLNNQLKPVLELRNRLAHGQWVYTLTNDQNDVSAELMRLINCENALSLQFKQQVLEHLSAAIHDLVVSPPTFQRDFDHHYKLLFLAKARIVGVPYDGWAQKLRNNFQRGRRKPLTE